MDKLFSDSMYNLVGQLPALALIIIVIGYVAKVFLDKRIAWLAGRMEEVDKASLKIKTELRSEELKIIVECRVEIEQWADFLMTGLFRLCGAKTTETLITNLQNEDAERFLKVKIAIAKAGLYLKDPELEPMMMNVVNNIRRHYYPVLNDSLLQLSGVLVSLMPYSILLEKLNKAESVGDMFSLGSEHLKTYNELLESMTKILQAYSDKITSEYREIAELLDDLRCAMNRSIYRPIQTTHLDKK